MAGDPINQINDILGVWPIPANPQASEGLGRRTLEKLCSGNPGKIVKAAMEIKLNMWSSPPEVESHLSLLLSHFISIDGAF